MRALVVLLLGVSVIVSPLNSLPGHAANESFEGRTLEGRNLEGRLGLAEAEAEPAGVATCAGLATSLSGFVEPDRRVDLWIEGVLTLVQTDGALWYLAVCSQPSIRVLCVTYSDNGMKLGDRVALRGAFMRQDPSHVLLDPCLASSEPDR